MDGGDHARREASGGRGLSVLVVGGYGVFGARVSHELALRGLAVIVAGRDASRARAFAASLGPGHRGLGLDARDASACRAALAGHRVAVHCAGPFRADDTALLDACLAAGCHYVDIADDRAYCAAVRARSARFQERGLTAVWGASSLPGVSLALARRARSGRPDDPRRARVTLFIGNDNPKSEAAILSVIRGLGRPIDAPQGTLRAFLDRERVTLPPPFGACTAGAFDAPYYDVLPAAVGVREVTVQVGFENVLAGPLFALLARSGARWDRRTARVFAALGRLYRRGRSGGVVLVELFWSDGSIRRAAIHAARDGQRLAALPAALAAQGLSSAASGVRGAVTVDVLLGAEALLTALQTAGFALAHE